MTLELPHNAKGPSRLIGADGRPIGTPQQNPVQFSMDTETGSIALVDMRTGSQVVFSASGVLGFRDAFGTSFLTREDGALEIRAKKIYIVAEEQPDKSPGVQVVELKPRPPAEYADTEGVPNPDR
jgi:hypothetical protein